MLQNCRYTTRTSHRQCPCRDTKNPTSHSKDRKFGDMRTTMIIAHAPPNASCFVKPQFANKPLIRDTFYRRTNVQFPDDCAAVNVSDA
jgi:hypothetical protein